MGEYLQGTLQQRMRELREARDYSQAKVAGILGIDKASYGRMENGTTRTVNSDVLTGLANLMHTKQPLRRCTGFAGSSSQHLKGRRRKTD